MAWADEVNLASDYPKEYTDAANAMAAAEKAYAIEKYVPAKTLAEEVSTTLSDQFQQEVLAAREAAKAKAAQAEEEARQKALNKELADAALADAETRMAWANEYQVRTDYPDQYKEASVAMVGAYVAYGNEDYLLSKEKAEQVSAILSDDFQVQVASDRAAKEQLAKDKAVADEVLPKARDRMAWAEQANIMADYPKEYQAAAASMTAAEKPTASRSTRRQQCSPTRSFRPSLPTLRPESPAKEPKKSVSQLKRQAMPRICSDRLIPA